MLRGPGGDAAGRQRRRRGGPGWWGRRAFASLGHVKAGGGGCRAEERALTSMVVFLCQLARRGKARGSMWPVCWLTQFMFTLEMNRTCGGLSCGRESVPRREEDLKPDPRRQRNTGDGRARARRGAVARAG